MQVEVYSDITCPWCYIGKRRFERALSVFPGGGDVQVVYHPYQLDPDAPAAPAPLFQHLQKKFGHRAAAMVQQVTEAALAEGIDMRFDRAVTANTMSAHRLLRLAGEEYSAAAQHELVEELFAAHFVYGGDVGDHALLVELAVDAGLDRTRVAAYLASDEGLEAVRARIRDAFNLGISAVPSFIFDKKYAIEGGQPAPVFLQALETVARESRGRGMAPDHAAAPVVALPGRTGLADGSFAAYGAEQLSGG